MAQFIFEFTEKMILAFEWDLRDIDGATHFIQYKCQICAISPYIQAKPIGNVVNLVNNTLMSIYWSGSCAIYLFILK